MLKRWEKWKELLLFPYFELLQSQSWHAGLWAQTSQVLHYVIGIVLCRLWLLQALISHHCGEPLRDKPIVRAVFASLTII